MPSFAAPVVWTAQAVRATTIPAGTRIPLKRPIEQYSLRWRTIDIIVVYTPDFHATVGDPFHHCHLEVMSERPRVQLPISETGYRSVFLPGDTIENAGGPVQYATRWLDHAANASRWKAAERDMRQGSLF